MKQTELMIHNYVSFDDFPVEITNIGLTHIEGYLNKYDTLYGVRLKLEHINPIPITEELLLKNGFDEPFYRTDTKCSTHVRSLENGCELWARFHVPRKYWYLDVVNEDGFILSSGKVDYLHQLQNLCNIAGVEMKWKV